MTPKQAAFVNEYLIDLNATQAAIRAGYSPTWANKQAHLLIGKNRQIAELIQKGLSERSERVKINADWVVCRLREEAEFQGEGSSPSARVKALELLGRHLGLFPVRGSLSLSLEGQVDVSRGTILEGRRIARRLILEEIRDESLVLPGDEE
ncbi:hypothetical protein SDC9_62698 [bioreactor metagenome]|uniref:Terminase small subunit n=1 Tax=bioreactor metagenome TaxID=1076179 RepID=A0A644XJF9_9ZZZZ